MKRDFFLFKYYYELMDLYIFDIFLSISHYSFFKTQIVPSLARWGPFIFDLGFFFFFLT